MGLQFKRSDRLEEMFNQFAIDPDDKKKKAPHDKKKAEQDKTTSHHQSKS